MVDLCDLTSWPEVKVPVRVIRSLETYSVRRQLDQQVQIRSSDWMWVTTLPSAQLPLQRAVAFGLLSAILFCGDVCEWLKQLTRKVRGPVKTWAQWFESSHHRHIVLEALGIWRAHHVRSGPSFGM